MANYKIKCEAIDVRSESGICPGSAKCRKGETYVLTARTPEPSKKKLRGSDLKIDIYISAEVS